MNYFFVGNRKHQSKNKNKKIKWITFLVDNRLHQELPRSSGPSKGMQNPEAGCLGRPVSRFELSHFCFVWQKLKKKNGLNFYIVVLFHKNWIEWLEKKLDSNLALYLHKKTVDRNQSVTLKKLAFLIDNLLSFTLINLFISTTFFYRTDSSLFDWIFYSFWILTNFDVLIFDVLIFRLCDHPKKNFRCFDPSMFWFSTLRPPPFISSTFFT